MKEININALGTRGQTQHKLTVKIKTCLPLIKILVKTRLRGKNHLNKVALTQPFYIGQAESQIIDEIARLKRRR